MNRGSPKKDLTGREKRVLKRKERFVELASSDKLFCEHYGHFLCPRDVENHHCYTGNRGKRYCPYILILK